MIGPFDFAITSPPEPSTEVPIAAIILSDSECEAEVDIGKRRVESGSTKHGLIT